MSKTTTVRAWLDEFRVFKQALFGLYERERCTLTRKIAARAGGTTWGYRLMDWKDHGQFSKMTGSSIGEDEIRIFYDICQLVQPTVCYVIGNAFGFSTFCLALAWPGGDVIAIDNWSEGEQGELARRLTMRIMQTNGLDNVRIHTGSSPDDTPAALEPLQFGGKSERLSLLFIDGLHTNDAARSDFVGALDYLDQHSLVLWHNADSVKEAFETSYEMEGKNLFDRHAMLRTYGPMGIYYNSRSHPLLEDYLRASCLIWQDWEKFISASENADRLPQLLRMRQNIVWRVAAGLRRCLQEVPNLVHRS